MEGRADNEVITDRRGNILVVRINRPEARNAFNGAVMAGIGSAVLKAEADPEIRVLILTGTGDRAFCAGMDLKAFAAGERASVPSDLMDGMLRLLRGGVVVPVVCAANASALAGGFELLLGCDVVVASSEAKFGLPEVKRGLFAAGNGTQLGMRLPMAVAMELMLTGDSIDAGRALELGLVNQVAPPDQVLEAALAFAGRIAANGPLAVQATKELARLWPVDAVAAEQRRTELHQSVFSSEDAREGASAFVEKRPPVWRGQ
jgi:enoyl-CoA hydratase